MFANIAASEVNTCLKSIIFHINVNSTFLSWEAVYHLAHEGGRQIASAAEGDARDYKRIKGGTVAGYGV